MPKIPLHRRVTQKQIAPLHQCLNNAIQASMIPQSVEELSAFLRLDRYQLWRACESELETTPMNCLDYIRAKRMLTELEKTPALKLMRLRRDLGLLSEDGFRRFCKRAFNLLPCEVKSNPNQAATSFAHRFAPLIEALNSPHKTNAQNQRTKPTHKTNAQNRHKKFLEEIGAKSKIHLILAQLQEETSLT
ncbi:MAG: hypothetical protein SNJ66_08720 [Chloroherpetonaceae bacterium]